ncbi:MAG: HEPN domain-containing protein [Bradymonadaceae bacterium]
MTNRARDWLRQGRRDLEHARDAAETETFEWACFAAQQGAEKAVKAVLLDRGDEAFGHGLLTFLEAVADSHDVDDELLDAARRLDRFYIPARYPNGFASGAPMDYFTEDDADEALEDAELIVEFCEDLLAGP